MCKAISSLLFGLFISSFAYNSCAQDRLKEMSMDVFLAVKYNSVEKIDKWIPTKSDFYQIKNSQNPKMTKAQMDAEFNKLDNLFKQEIAAVHQIGIDSCKINWSTSVIHSIITSFESNGNLDTIKVAFMRTHPEIYIWTTKGIFSLTFGPLRNTPNKSLWLYPSIKFYFRPPVVVYNNGLD